MTTESLTSLNEKCSFTADNVAYARTFTDIPFSQKIFEIMERLAGPFDPDQKARIDAHRSILPFFESRFKLTDMIINETGISQVLELASGLSPRGLIMSRNAFAHEDDGFCFVELDLPEKIAFKQRVLEELIGRRLAWPATLILEEGNVADKIAFNRACEYFDNGQVAVISEGLLRYMSWDDKSALAKNVASLLRKNGGIWTTPDIELLCEVNSSPETQKRYDGWAQKFGFDLRPLLFNNLDHAFTFFEDHGFKVEHLTHDEIISRLVSPGRLGLSDEVVREELSKHSTFIMTVRN